MKGWKQIQKEDERLNKQSFKQIIFMAIVILATLFFGMLAV